MLKKPNIFLVYLKVDEGDASCKSTRAEGKKYYGSMCMEQLRDSFCTSSDTNGTI